MIKMEKGEITVQGALSEIVMDWLCISNMLREDVLAKNLGDSAAADCILRDMTNTVIDHGKDLTDGMLNSEALQATRTIARTVAKFMLLQDAANKEAGQEDD